MEDALEGMAPRGIKRSSLKEVVLEVSLKEGKDSESWGGNVLVLTTASGPM